MQNTKTFGHRNLEAQTSSGQFGDQPARDTDDDTIEAHRRRMAHPMNNDARPSDANTPGGVRISWFTIVMMFLSSICITGWALYNEYRPRTWSIPTESSLIYASGHFLPNHMGSRRPYLFQTDEGRVLKLGCEPDGIAAVCLSEHGWSLPWLAPQPTTVGYFKSPNLQYPAMENVLTTLSASGVELISYPQAVAHLQEWAAHEDEIRNSNVPLVVNLMPLILTALAVWAAIRKLSY